MSETQKVPRRDEIPVEYTWDLSTVYADDEAWEEDIGRLEGMLPQVAATEGTIGQGAQALLRALKLRDDVTMRLWQIYIYANRRLDSDSTDPIGQALAERAGSVVARIGAATAFIDPEILAIPAERIAAWQREEPRLQVYTHALKELARQRAHVRSAEVEGILAEYGDVTRAPNEIYDVLTNADIVFPTIEDEQSQPVQLSHARYGRYMESQDRRVRRDAFKGMYSAIGGLRNTLGTVLAAEIRSHTISARVRNYQSSLEAALDPHAIPLDVYHNLITTINANLPRLHRYMDVRKRIMGLDELHIYDLYAPIVPEVELIIPYAEATTSTLAAFAPLGEEYTGAVQKTFSSRWVDVYENVGKRSGAYSDGSYTTAPFILLNYQDRLEDVFTLAHELGHSMHSFFTRRNQPFVYGNYTLFVAEVASTLNEALLTSHLLKTRDDPELRRRLIVKQLEGIRQTIIRQTMFAEFELDMHQRVEAGDPLTADSLSKRYYDLVGRYHGPTRDAGRRDRGRVGPHPALLLQLLCLPVRDRALGGAGAEQADHG